MTKEIDTAEVLSRPLRVPSQPRAKATFEKILDAAVTVLAADGLRGLNTNRIAEVAGVNVATLYSYFVNKENILAYLATRFEDERATHIETVAQQLGTTGDWEAWFSDSIDAMVNFRLEEPGGLVVRQALMALPNLSQIDRESTRRATEAKIDGIRLIAPHLSEAKARTISHVYTLTVTAVLDEAFRSTPHDEQMVAQLKTMIFSYLRHEFRTA